MWAMQQQLMTLKEVAEYIRLNEKTVTHLAQSGELVGSKIANQWRFERDAVTAWAASHNQPSDTETRQPVLSEVTGMPASLTVEAVLSLNRINLGLAGADKDAVLRELTAMVIPPARKQLSETLFQALKAREDLCSTCVEEGVAIPHSRNALVGLVSQPVLAYGRHRTGIDYGAMDGKPVRHFFLLCAPNVRQHLQLLGRLARLIKDPELRAALNSAEQPEHVIALIHDAERTA
jgi:excisionase family DNA binding protein